MSLQQLYAVLLTGSIVLLVGIAAARTASRLGLPGLLLFLALGVLLGEDVLGVDFDDAQLAPIPPSSPGRSPTSSWPGP